MEVDIAVEIAAQVQITIEVQAHRTRKYAICVMEQKHVKHVLVNTDI